MGKSGSAEVWDAGVTTGNKREYKMRDLIATTARQHERNADDVPSLFTHCNSK